MAYDIDTSGTVAIGPHKVPVPRTISAQAQAYLRRAPWGDAPLPEGPMPMWHMRAHVDAQMVALGETIRGTYPVDITEIEIAGVRCHLVRPLDLPPENAVKVLINLHGGGFVLGSGSLGEAIPVAHLAKVPVIAVDYRLAPEHPFPAAVDDVVAVYRAVLEHHAPEHVGIYGTSAGGFITAQTIMRLHRDGIALPACCGVFTAGGDLDDLGDTAQIFTLSGFYGDRVLPTDHEMSEIRAYLKGADRSDPLVSPIRGDLAHFPPTLLVSGTRDAILSATALFHRALRRAGADAELFVFEAMPHAHWYLIDMPESQEAVDVMVRFFLKHLDGTQVEDKA